MSLTRVPVARYKLELIPTCAWLQVAADFILRLTRVPAAELDLQLTYTLIHQVNLRTHSAKYIIFMVWFLPADFSYHWSRLWLLLQELLRRLNQLEEGWTSFNTLAAIDSSCRGSSSCDGWFETCDQLTASRIWTPSLPDNNFPFINCNNKVVHIWFDWFSF